MFEFPNFSNQQLRPFSRSLSSSSFAQQRPTNSALLQYINPSSEKAPRVFQAHNRHSGKAEENYKTVMCQNWLEQAECRFGSKCRFAHGPEELRTSTVPLPINSKYKTRLCEKYTKNGVCPYGERCLFIHPDQQFGLTTTSSTFATSLPLSRNLWEMFHFQQMTSATFRPHAQQKPPLNRQNRNLLPQIEEEMMRREREEPVVHQQMRNGLRLEIPPAPSVNASSPHTPEQEWCGLADMVDKLTLTPSAKMSPADYP